MGLRNRKSTDPQVVKQHCQDCNGVGNCMRKDYDQKPNSTGSYPTVEVRCGSCNGQGWTAA
ncbi:hypothetical protein [Nonomuraea sp. NPDC049158]|uniref:hypothetical protein n=1 Tax=Nonomuraea sp. NPDC049158 TaxID=3155649 RepID=UPI00340D9FBA